MSQWQFTYQDGMTSWPVDCICCCHVPLASSVIFLGGAE